MSFGLEDKEEDAYLKEINSLLAKITDIKIRRILKTQIEALVK